MIGPLEPSVTRGNGMIIKSQGQSPTQIMDLQVPTTGMILMMTLRILKLDP